MRHEDLAACARLYARVFNRAPWNGKWTARTAARHTEETWRDAGFLGLVAFQGDSLIGFAYGLIFQWERQRHFYLKEMCVSAGSQRSGIGSRLMTMMVDKLRREDVGQISLGTDRGTPAERFYLRFGFTIDAATIIMKKAAAPGSSKV